MLYFQSTDFQSTVTDYPIMEFITENLQNIQVNSWNAFIFTRRF